MTAAIAAVPKALLVAHTIAAGVLIGASTHLGIQSVQLVRGRPRPALLRIYPPVALAAWAVAFTLGALLYPRYRVDVRGAYLDANVSWAAVLFDVKENLAVFVGPLLGGAWWLARGIASDRDRTLQRWFVATCVSASMLSWWNAISGLLVASIRSV